MVKLEMIRVTAGETKLKIIIKWGNRSSSTNQNINYIIKAQQK